MLPASIVEAFPVRNHQSEESNRGLGAVTVGIEPRGRASGPRPGGRVGSALFPLRRFRPRRNSSGPRLSGLNSSCMIRLPLDCIQCAGKWQLCGCWLQAPEMRARAYEQGCVRGAFTGIAKLRGRPVNGEPRARERLGFFRFRQYPQGFMRYLALTGRSERAR